MAHVEPGPSSVQAHVSQLHQMLSGKAAARIDGLAKGVCPLEQQALSKALLQAHVHPLVVGLAVVLAVGDAAETRIQAVQPTIKQVAREAVDLIVLIQLCSL